MHRRGQRVNNRMMLGQMREAFAFHIAQSPDTVSIRRRPLVPDGFGGMVTDPFGATTVVTMVARLAHERFGVQDQQVQPVGLDTAMSLFIIWPWDLTVNENEIIEARGRLFKVGVPDALKKFGGIQGWQAPLIPAGDVASGLVTGVSLNGTDPEQLTISDTFQLIPTFEPESAADQAVTWVSGDEAVATVDSDGLVTAVSGGFALVTVTTHDGSFTASRLFQVAA